LWVFAKLLGNLSDPAKLNPKEEENMGEITRIVTKLLTKSRKLNKK